MNLAAQRYNKDMRTLYIAAMFFSVFAVTSTVHAQDSAAAQVASITYVKAEVVAVLGSDTRLIAGTVKEAEYQMIEARLLEGPDVGETVIIDNDFLKLKRGDIFYARHNVDPVDHIDAYTVAEPYRLPILAFVVGLFLLLLFVFGGKQGIRGLLALVASFFFIGYMLLPGILAGYSPVLVSLGVSALIIVLGSYITHGFNRTTSAAVIGMLLTIAVTGALALWVVDAGNFSGYTSDEVTYLNFNTHGSIDFVGLMLGGIMIGLLGVLYDAAISQAIAVEELLGVGGHLTRMQIIRRALRIGREHIGALVNTLAIAYVGASLPLLLLFSISTQKSPEIILNQEIFAAEIVRTMVGSIGLILAVPITTFIAAYVLSRTGVGQEASGANKETHTH